MERKSIKKKNLEKFADEVTNDDEQILWEKKELGRDPKYAGKSDLYKPPSKLISIRVPEEILELLKAIADKEGLRYQTYIISLLKKHVRQKKAG